MNTPSPRNSHSHHPLPVVSCEADVAEGLEALARDEIRRQFTKQARLFAPVEGDELTGVVRFSFSGRLETLLKLRMAQAVYLVEHFPVPRPKALLGDAHFRRALAQIETVRSLFPAQAFKTLYLNAAGSDSSVMVRLKNELAARSGLAVGDEEGDLLMRVRPSNGKEAGGWDVLVRISPRPLATRPWRMCNLEGALNAAVAHAVTRLTLPAPQDTFLNIACGSGTLLIERLSAGRARQVIGCDVDRRALDCAQVNITASGHAEHIRLCLADARNLPLADHSVDALAADLPFGHLIGTHAENVRSYPLILQEAARVARTGARFALITHEVRLMEQLLSGEHSPWSLDKALRVELGGLYPRIFVLRRRANRI